MNDHNLLLDTREISEIWIDSNSCYRVGIDVDKIEVFAQGAFHCDVPWFAVWVGGAVKTKVNGLCIQCVIYKE